MTHLGKVGCRMIIIRNTRLDNRTEQRILERNIRNQALTGLIVLPEYCELLHTDPGENNVVVKHVFIGEEGKISTLQDLEKSGII